MQKTASSPTPHLSCIVGNLLGGLVGGLLCIGAYRLGFGQHLPNMIVGTIIALVPGVPFTKGIRDLANEDYIAGGTRPCSTTGRSTTKPPIRSPPSGHSSSTPPPSG